MACTVRSVRPTAELMSRIRAWGFPAISTSTRPCPVSSVQLPLCSSGGSMDPEYNLAGEFSREDTHEVFLTLILTGPLLGAEPCAATRPLLIGDGDDWDP